MHLDKSLISKSGGRVVNEDCCAWRESGGYWCFILADGLGGHHGGAIASRIAVEKVLEAFAADPGMTVELFRQYLDFARDAFRVEKMAHNKLNTTLVILLSDKRKAMWAHVGDSRLYFFRSGSLEFQTKDHSVPQRMAAAGDISPGQIRFHEDRNRLTAVFDGDEASRLECLETPVSLKRGDAFLLCSDGFWEYVVEEEMVRDLAESLEPRGWIGRMEQILLERAAPGCDNYSAVAVMLK